jgi:hypothetical protein
LNDAPRRPNLPFEWQPWYTLHVIAWIVFLFGHSAIFAARGLDFNWQDRIGQHEHCRYGLYTGLDIVVIAVAVLLLLVSLRQAKESLWIALLLMPLYAIAGVVVWFVLAIYAYLLAGGPI